MRGTYIPASRLPDIENVVECNINVHRIEFDKILISGEKLEKTFLC